MKILLVEGDHACRQVTYLGLAQFAEVEAVASAGEALAAYGRSGPYDLLIISCELPDKTGPALLEELHKRSAEQVAIFYTDRLSNALGMLCRDFDRLHIVDVWRKPIAIIGLAERVSRTLRHGAFAYCQAQREVLV